MNRSRSRAGTFARVARTAGDPVTADRARALEQIWLEIADLTPHAHTDTTARERIFALVDRASRMSASG